MFRVLWYRSQTKTKIILFYLSFLETLSEILKYFVKSFKGSECLNRTSYVSICIVESPHVYLER